MKDSYKIDLTTLVKPPLTDSISGRAFGARHALETRILEHLNNGESIVIIIDKDKVKAINDSFIKGFFSNVFENKYSLEKIKSSITIDSSNENFKKLFEKNWEILNSICNG